MYTQCPECGSAFRVTAEVLKVAAGKVRCGSCANAFNALEYLSEEMPEQNSAAPEAEPQLPELKPEPAQKDDGLPESISAEQSAALLKTLDELAGSDIRIEDTGVEWRLLDDDDEDDNVDEVLEDSPTPVDEFLTSTPEVVEAPEIFEESANGPAQTPVEELRFDDNTPLPEDFGFEDTPVEAPPIVEAEPEPEPEPEAVEPQPDITLSDPHEWTDILDEFEDLASESARPLDAELDALLEEEEQADEDAEVLDDADTEEDLDELLAVEDDDEDATRVDELVEEEPVDEDTSLADLEFEDEDEELGEDEDDDAEAEADEEPVADDEDDEDLEDDEDALEDDLDEDVPEDSLDKDEDQDEETEEEDLEDDEELDVIDDDPQLDLIEEPDVEEHDIEAELALLEDGEDESDDDEVEADDEDSGEHYVPPMTEEEQTVNMQIDQELFAIAVEDEDGFASTIVIPEDWSEEDALKAKDRASDDADSDDVSDQDDDADDAPVDTQATDVGFETIIMEGAEVKGALDDEKRAADVAEAAELQAIAKAAEAEAAKNAGSSRYGMIAGVVVLVLLLVVQIVHQSREALATNEVFNNTFGPIYRALGNPLQPSWDITGWQFEATRGSAEMQAEDNSAETNETLTVYSRIGNNSESALPYPLIRISLIDRVMEPLGSHVLEPKDYLGENMDPRKLVEPGESFEAAISVKLESEGVPNFQLHVCYRHSDLQLRCKDENFK